MKTNENKKSGFTNSLGFVLAAAGSAVGLGNIWRFPYLAAKNGGIFIYVYIILAFTFGFALLTTDIAIGRKTGKSALDAYGSIGKKWKFCGVLSFLVPAIILSYYGVVGGWIVKYMAAYLTGAGHTLAADGYFTGFITSPVSPIVFMFIFMAITALIVYMGVEKGIEKVSKFMMPVLVLLAGAFLLARPTFIGTAVGTVAGAALIIYGVSELLSSWKMRKAMDEYEIRQGPKEEPQQESQAPDVKDVDYEKVDEQ